VAHNESVIFALHFLPLVLRFSSLGKHDVSKTLLLGFSRCEWVAALSICDVATIVKSIFAIMLLLLLAFFVVFSLCLHGRCRQSIDKIRAFLKSAW